MTEYIKLTIKEILKLADKHNIDTTQPINNVLKDITKYSSANMDNDDVMLNVITNQPVFERMSPGVMYNLCRLSKSWRDKCNSLDKEMWISYYAENKKKSVPKWIKERYNQLPKWFVDKYIYFPEYYKDKSLNFIKNYYFTSDIQISPGYNVVTGLRSDGTVHSWGGDKFEFDDVDNKNFIQIANSATYTACLKSDGSVYFFNSMHEDIDPMYDIVQIACGFGHTVGLKRDGSVATYSIPAPLNNKDFIQVSCGENHAVGLRSDGTVTTWYTDDGEAGQKQNEPGSDGGPPNKDFIYITCGDFQSAGLRKDGSIVLWGTPLIPTPLNNKDFIEISCGYEHVVGLRADGTVVTLGGLDMSIKSDEPGSNTGEPNSDFIQISCGSFHSVGLKSDGTVVMWGNVAFGQRRNQPGSLNGVPNKDFIRINCKEHITTGLKIDGTCITWGRIKNVSPENLLV